MCYGNVGVINLVHKFLIRAGAFLKINKNRKHMPDIAVGERLYTTIFHSEHPPVRPASQHI